jgi:tetratricopeptide (TPR) repeat protein
MKSKRTWRIIKMLLGGIAGVGLAIVAYAGWQTYHDFQALKQIKAKYKAVETYQKAVKQQPKDAQAYLNLGNAWMDFHQNSGKGYRLAIQLNDIEMLSLMMSALPSREGAIAAYSKALALDPTLAAAYGGLCLAKVQTNISTEAQKTLATCRKAIELQPQWAQVHLALGVALWDQHKVDDAVTVFRRAVALEPNNGNTHYQLGRALVDQNNSQEAEKHLRKAIALNPEGNMSYISLGNALTDQGKPNEAIAAYRQSIQVSPDQPLAYAFLGDVLIQQKRTDEAISNAQEMIRRYPSFSSGYQGLGAALSQKNRLQEAIAAYNQAATKAPNDLFILTERGTVYARAGNTAKAMADFREAVKFHPKAADAFNALCWNGGLLGQAEQVMGACNQAVALDHSKRKPLYQDGRGLVRALTGDRKGAIADFQAFIEWSKATEKTTPLVPMSPAQLNARQQRLAWIAELKQGRNPFTPELKQALLKE